MPRESARHQPCLIACSNQRYGGYQRTSGRCPSYCKGRLLTQGRKRWARNLCTKGVPAGVPTEPGPQQTSLPQGEPLDSIFPTLAATQNERLFGLS